MKVGQPSARLAMRSLGECYRCLQLFRVTPWGVQCPLVVVVVAVPVVGVVPAQERWLVELE